MLLRSPLMVAIDYVARHQPTWIQSASSWVRERTY